ncbi:DUF6809 family protein [Alicyclobacillus macrosporangiidus]|uniref:Uncharacterized protein n=1 Tax=Alicyclobacillus macrosporangiidus TaxID=392015 RepID=A0A1I7IAT5_9BACL|nr:hypothetical protein SAMN05421543_106105 [Alicyclobacillus macrosporangiidus]
MSRISDLQTNGPSETLEKYQNAARRVVESLAWLRANLNERQNAVLDDLMEAIETCTDMEWNGALVTGFDLGAASSHDGARQP